MILRLNLIEPPYFIIFETKTSLFKIHIIMILHHQHTKCVNKNENDHKTKIISYYCCLNNITTIHVVYLCSWLSFWMVVSQNWSQNSIFHEILQNINFLIWIFIQVNVNQTSSYLHKFIHICFTLFVPSISFIAQVFI